MEIAGTVRVGNAPGFVATITGQVAKNPQKLSVTIEHAGGWSPFVGGRLKELFTTPKFFGRMGMATSGSGADTCTEYQLQAEARWEEDIELIPGMLVIDAPTFGTPPSAPHLTLHPTRHPPRTGH